MSTNAQNSKVLFLTGHIAAGRGVGTRSVATHQAAIAGILGAAPYPGTLNVVLDTPVVLRHAQPVDEKGKLFGVRGTINGTPCLISRFHGAPLHVFEIIAATQLRAALGLSDGQTVEICLPQENTAAPATWRRRLWEFFYAGRLQAYYDDRLHGIFVRRGIKFFHKKICQSKKEFA